MKATPEQRRVWAVVSLAILTLFGTVAVLEAMQIDIGRFFLPCGIQQQYHIPCPTCGMTTALRAFARGDILTAFAIQPAAGLLYCLLVTIAGIGLFITISGTYPAWLHRWLREIKLSWVFWFLVVVILAGWAVTLSRALIRRQ